MRTSFVDYHNMLEQLQDEEEPVCDFGIFVSSQSDSELKFGDFVIALDDEDLLETTAGQMRVLIGRLDRSTKKELGDAGL